MLRIQEIRRRKGIPQHKLAQVLDMPQPRISEFENEKRRLHLDEAVKIAQYLGVKLDDLVTGSSSP